MSERKVALVTGGTRGIGLGIARALASDGCDVMLAGRRPAADVVEAIQGLETLGAQVGYHAGDLAEASVRSALFDATIERFGRCNVLVNNAGAGSRDRGVDMLDVSEENFAWMLQTNLRGPFFLTQLVARHQVEQRAADPDFPAAIVNIGSISAEIVSITRGDYCISKAGIGMMSRLWAARLGSEGIPVWEVRPGLIATDMTAGAKDRYDEQIAQGLLVDARWGQPEDVGKAVAMLARGDLLYATGQVLCVDGGLSWQRL